MMRVREQKWVCTCGADMSRVSRSSKDWARIERWICKLGHEWRLTVDGKSVKKEMVEPLVQKSEKDC